MGLELKKIGTNREIDAFIDGFDQLAIMTIHWYQTHQWL